jgi:hypothetical protein
MGMTSNQSNIKDFRIRTIYQQNTSHHINIFDQIRYWYSSYMHMIYVLIHINAQIKSLFFWRKYFIFHLVFRQVLIYMRKDSKYEITDFNLLNIIQEFRLSICTGPSFYAPTEPGNCSAKEVRTHRIFRDTCSVHDDKRTQQYFSSAFHK